MFLPLSICITIFLLFAIFLSLFLYSYRRKREREGERRYRLVRASSLISSLPRSQGSFLSLSVPFSPPSYQQAIKMTTSPSNSSVISPSFSLSPSILSRTLYSSPSQFVNISLTDLTLRSSPPASLPPPSPLLRY